MTHTIYLPDGEAISLLPDAHEALGRLVRERLGADAGNTYDTLLYDLIGEIDDLKSELACRRTHVSCPNCGAQVDLED